MYKILLAAIVAVVIGVAGWFLWHGQFSAAVKEYKSVASANSGQISFSYPKDYQAQPKPAATRTAEPLLKLSIQNPLSMIDLNKEKGAIIAANVIKAPFLDTLEKNSQKALPLTYPDYKNTKSERIKISGHDATVISFNYLGKDQKTRLFAYLYIIPQGNDAYYLTIQSVDQKRAGDDAQKIQSSLRLNWTTLELVVKITDWFLELESL